MEDSSLKSLFAAGDRVRHPKFGKGTVGEVWGNGKDARVRIQFDDGAEKELALSIAPIIRLEEEE
jgi:DNA helicase-2/ATP-dependent DNA helicase PcrA